MSAPRRRGPGSKRGPATIGPAPAGNRRRRSRSPRRLVALFVLLTLAFGAMAVRLIVVQVVQYPRYAGLAAEFRQRDVVFTAHRGAIFDRRGEALALSVDLKTVFADPVLIDDPARTARKLARVLDVPADEIEEVIRSVPGNRFEYVARQVDPVVAEKVEALELAGIYLRPESKRIYPADRLASHVVGFVNLDGDALGGIEYKFDDVLAGRPGRMTLEQDPSGRALPQADYSYEAARPGRSLFLTIDRDLQRVTELALGDAVQRYGASSGGALVIRPSTGEVLAMANAPDYDPNSFAEFTDESRRNRIVTDVYEPGSAFKIVTLAAALQEGVVTPRSIVNVPDQLQVSDRVIHDSHVHPAEDMSVREIIEQSSNVGTVKLGLQLGPDRLDEWVRKFGFGSKTGLDFPGEAPGIVIDRDTWSGSTIGTVPLGQGVAVTQLQLAAAYGALANDGVWVQPKLLHAVMAPDGRINAAPAAARHRVVSRKTARRVLSILTGVVKNGTGVLAQVPGYEVAGKTGTAQKPLPGGGYGDSYVASFAGVAPARDPELLVVVTLDEPDPIWGGATAAPTFRQIMEYGLRHLGVAPDTNAARAAEEIRESKDDAPAVRD